MPTYAIGDVQGCYQQLLTLLETINFNVSNDQLWFVGDLVNRGPESLAVVDFCMQLPNKPIIVLGNHDLHFLAVATGKVEVRKKDTFHDLLDASNLNEIIDWFRQQPLTYYDKNSRLLMVHAGVPPQWDLTQCLSYAKEVESVLQSDNYTEFFDHMYGNKPKVWIDSLDGWKRLRMITNYLTRMRFCDIDGTLELSNKHGLGSQSAGFYPWFDVPNRKLADQTILFGHWASLGGKSNNPNAIALDTACVWGGTLTAMRIEDRQIFSV